MRHAYPIGVYNVLCRYRYCDTARRWCECDAMRGERQGQVPKVGG